MPYFKYDGVEFVHDDTNEISIVIGDASAFKDAKENDVFFISDEHMIEMDVTAEHRNGTPVKYYTAGVILIPIVLNGAEIETTDTNHQLLIDVYFGRNQVGAARKVPLLKRLMENSSIEPPTIDTKGYYIGHDVWYYLVRNVTRKKSTLLLGDTGSGKTELAELVALAMGMPFNKFNMAISNPYSALCGKVHAEAGTTSFVRARFSMVIEQPNQFILLDELSRAVPTATNILLPVLDTDKKLYIEDANTVVDVDPSNVFFATANIGSSYSGTYQVDGALFDRFSKIEIPYLPLEILTKVLAKRAGILEREAKRIAEISIHVRNENLSLKISTREALEVADLVADGYSIAQAFEFAVLSKYDGGDDGNGERSILRSFIQTGNFK